MKKFLSRILCLSLVVLSVFTFAGCSKEKENYSVNNVSSNGGLAVISNGYMYYCLGGTKDYNDVNSTTLKNSSIYKRTVDAKGNPTGDPELVYECLAGNVNGSLYVFGDFIYFTTPSNKMSNTAQKMTDRTSFCRVRVTGEDYKVLYTTETSNTLSYEYYAVSDNELYIAVLEGSELYSVKVGKGKSKVKEIASNVTSAVFTSTNGRGNGPENYIFYTTAPTAEYLTQKGNFVFRVDASGENSTRISTAENVTLNAIKFGYLYYSIDGIVYRTTDTTGLSKVNVVSYMVFDDMLFTENGGVYGSSKDNSKVVYVRVENGVVVDTKSLASGSEYTFIGAQGNYIYMLNSSKVMNRLDITKENQSFVKVSENTTLNISMWLSQEIIGDYIYYYKENTTVGESGNSVKTWDLCSVNLTQVKEK